MNSEPILQESAVNTGWPMRRVALRVQNLESSITYYENLGLSIVRDERSKETGTVGLGVSTREVLQLRHLPYGKVRQKRSAGLYHFALLLPNDAELGSFIQHCIDQNIPIGGASDHLGTHSLYLSDPEGNGIEVYADGPRERWPHGGGPLAMPTVPLNIDNLLQQAYAFTGFPEELLLGHMHLNVGNLERSKPFYQQFGLNLMIEMPGSADFLSWEGYHHHLGMNLWTGPNAQPTADDVYGIDFFEFHRPELSPTTLQDPDGITVVVS